MQISIEGGSMIAGNTTGLDKAAQVVIGERLSDMYHSATAIHNISIDLVESTSIESQHMLRAIQEMAKSQARDLNQLAEILTGEHTGFFEHHFNKI
jgi:hypothetical protein